MSHELLKPLPRSRVLLDEGWKFLVGDHAAAHLGSCDDAAWRCVDLPHDWSIEGAIAPTHPMGAAGGFFPAGTGFYRRRIEAPESWRGQSISVEFEGVYMNADVFLNGNHIASHPYGYTPFCCDLTHHLKHGATNVLVVRVDNSRHLNSRWYSGSGIYRHVWLTVAAPVHVAPWGVFVSTTDVSAESARVSVRTQVEGHAASGLPAVVRTQLFGPDGAPCGVPKAVAQFDADASLQEIALLRPALWTPETPQLYRARTEVLVDGRVVDAVDTVFGVRSIAWSVARGLELNGRTVKLCGGCVHHDHGCLGAASFDAAEERKVRLLKQAGFNAVRTSHNPPAPAFLDACDRLGLLVMSELCDGWTEPKNAHDYGVHMREWWQRDLDAMIRSERNHPSIVIWSVGNEMMERFKPAGAQWAATLANHVRALDSTRPVSAAVCAPWSAGEKWPESDALFGALDIGGYNYNLNEHVADHQRVQSRIMACTESYPSAAFEYWAYATDHSYIIGDFVWTAMDYLGEAGIGRWLHGDTAEIVHGDNRLYPWHGACCGDLDLCGDRRALSHYRAILWDRGESIYLAVRPPDPAAGPFKSTLWAVPLPCASWTWPGSEGKTLEVEVYAKADCVRLFLNDRLIGEAPATRAQQFKARFSVPYAAGVLRAVAILDGRELGECVLRTAGAPAAIRLKPEPSGLCGDSQALCFVPVEIVDAAGVFQPNADNELTFSVEGPGVIAGVGSGDLSGEEPYQGNRRRASRGRALVVIRAQKQAGTIVVKAVAAGLATGVASIEVSNS